MKKKSKISLNTEVKVTDTVLTNLERDLINELANDVTEGEFIVEVLGHRNELCEPPNKQWQPDTGNQVQIAGPYPGNVIYNNGAKYNEGFAFNNSDSVENDLQNIIIYSYVNSNNAYRKWSTKKKIGLLCISSIHEYEDVKDVLLCWKVHLSPKARVAVFGSDKPGPSKAIIECTGDTGNFLLEKTAGMLKVIRLDACTHYWLIDSDEIGICRYCGRKRDFKKLMRQKMADENRKRRTKTNTSISGSNG